MGDRLINNKAQNARFSAHLDSDFVVISKEQHVFNPSLSN